MNKLHPKVAATAYWLQVLLRSHKGKLQCAGCHTLKEASAAWAVGAYQPFTRGKKAGAYLICPVCASTKASIDRAALYVETPLRDMDESGVKNAV